MLLEIIITCLILVGIWGAVFAQSGDSGPIVVYNFEGDYAGVPSALNGVNTTALSAVNPSGFVPGHVGSAANFSWTNPGWLVSQQELPLPSGNQARSLSVWIKIRSTQSETVAGWGAPARNQAFFFTVQGNNVGMTSWYNDAKCFVSTATLLSRWHHFLLAYDGSVASLYIDGVLSCSRSPVNGTLNTANGASSRLWVGTHIQGTTFEWPDRNDAFGGQLDDLAIYDRVLTSAEIAVLAGSAAPTPSGSPQASTSASKTMAASVTSSITPSNSPAAASQSGSGTSAASSSSTPSSIGTPSSLVTATVTATGTRSPTSSEVASSSGTTASTLTSSGTGMASATSTITSSASGTAVASALASVSSSPTGASTSASSASATSSSSIAGSGSATSTGTISISTSASAAPQPASVSDSLTASPSRTGSGSGNLISTSETISVAGIPTATQTATSSNNSYNGTDGTNSTGIVSAASASNDRPAAGAAVGISLAAGFVIAFTVILYRRRSNKRRLMRGPSGTLIELNSTEDEVIYRRSSEAHQFADVSPLARGGQPPSTAAVEMAGSLNPMLRSHGGGVKGQHHHQRGLAHRQLVGDAHGSLAGARSNSSGSSAHGGTRDKKVPHSGKDRSEHAPSPVVR